MKFFVGLTNEDHQHHPMRVDRVRPGQTPLPPPARQEDGTFLIELNAERDLVIMCVPCNVRLMEGEDFTLTEPEPWRGL